MSGTESLTKEELQLMRNKAKVLFDEIFGTSFFRVLEFHTVEGENLFEKLTEDPKQTYERIRKFFENIYTLETVFQMVDSKIYERYGVSGIMPEMIEFAKNGDEIGISKTIKVFLSYTR